MKSWPLPGDNVEILVDSNVILDVVTADPVWFEWSSMTLSRCADEAVLVINPVVYAEVSVGFRRIEDLEDVLTGLYFRRDAIPYEAAFLAGKCFLEYRRKGGLKESTLPDFFIGAHASVTGMTLLTRDSSRYRTYFPRLTIVNP
jgi:predicted nucleic acid-binding protein